MFAKIASVSYLCSQHTTKQRCLEDTKNSCDMFTTSLGSALPSGLGQGANDWCDISDGALADLMLQYSVCPGSLFDKYLRCNSTSDAAASCAANAAGCRWMENCNLFAPCCLPADLVSMSDAQQLQMLQDIKTAKPEVWGCCDGQKLWSKVVGCMNANSSSDCAGDCYWDPYAATCLVDRGAWFAALLTDKDNEFVQFVGQVDAKCANLSDPFTCNNQPAVGDISGAKAAQYSQAAVERPLPCIYDPAAASGGAAAPPANSPRPTQASNGGGQRPAALPLQLLLATLLGAAALAALLV